MDNEINKKGAIAVRQQKEKELILEQLRKIPIIETACSRAQISRATFYRLRAEDPEFKTSVEEAIAEGVSFINDMSESQAISLIKEKNWPAISFWLRARHPAYRQKVDMDARITPVLEKLTPEQEELIGKALRLAALPVTDINSHE